MRFTLPLLALASAALGTVMPARDNAASDLSNLTEVTNTTAAEFHGAISGTDSSLIPDTGATNGNRDPNRRIVNLWENTNFKGKHWFCNAGNMGTSYESRMCCFGPHSIMSSIEFLGDDFHCYIYENDECKTPPGNFAWLGSSMRNLKDMGWNDKMFAIACQWRS